uniref:ZnMc domain-containing protein n=1 Tax=Heterorhabditis bacteriophora TaxID=37862 RepID=A0A1I7WU12_HETBA
MSVHNVKTQGGAIGSTKNAYIIQRMERVDSFIRHSKPRLKRYAIEESAQVWEEQTELRFTYKEKGDVHIEISFTTGAHGDGEPFDGRGKILAHAYFPRYGGDLHFDDDELWSIDKYGLDLYAVAVHEVGHALGLKHSAEGEAIMAPFYQKYTGENIHLHKGNILFLSFFLSLSLSFSLFSFSLPLFLFLSLSIYIYMYVYLLMFSQSKFSRFKKTFTLILENKYWKYSRWGMPRTWPRSIDSLFRGKVIISVQYILVSFTISMIPTPVLYSPEINTGKLLDSVKVYCFTFRYMKVAEDYPRSTADIWFNCDGKTHMEK